MNRLRSDNLIHNNSGETLVEIMVAFIVLMIVVAMFTGAITSASAAVNHSIDIRRTSDDEYVAFHSALNEEKRTNSASALRVTETAPKQTTITGTAGDVTLTAYQYKSGDTIYWVYR